MKDFKRLNVFQKIRQFNFTVYSQTKFFPESERFGITSQIRRASISIATNLAEGCGRNSNKEFARFLEIAYASANEVECLIILSTDLKMITEENSNVLYGTLEEIKKMLYAFIQKLRTED
jgi:four helix bundle protein